MENFIQLVRRQLFDVRRTFVCLFSLLCDSVEIFHIHILIAHHFVRCARRLFRTHLLFIEQKCVVRHIGHRERDRCAHQSDTNSNERKNFRLYFLVEGKWETDFTDKLMTFNHFNGSFFLFFNFQSHFFDFLCFACIAITAPNGNIKTRWECVRVCVGGSLDIAIGWQSNE